MAIGRLWWVRRGGEPKGPFPAAVIEKNIAQGRILAADQLSVDRQSWGPASDYPDFDVLAANANVAARERTQPAARGPAAGETVASADVLDEAALTARIARSERVWSSLRPARPRQRLLPYLLLSLLVIGLFVLAVTRSLPSSSSSARCAEAPRPEVNWEYCVMTGRNLRGAQLAGATLRNAQLAGADLGGADLRGADLAYADLSNALLRDAQLDGARLVGASLSAAVLEGASLAGADLGFADLTGAIVKRSVFTRTRFEQTVMPSGQRCSAGGTSDCERTVRSP